MLTLAFISQKGGAGKTTLACATAVAAERTGLTTVLVDLEAAKSTGAELIVIDIAPHAADAALAAARAADAVLIPCRASAADLAAISATINVARLANRPAHAVLNAVPVRNPLADQARAAIARYAIETSPVVMHQRIDHVHAWTNGLTAQESAPRSKAAGETEALFDWLRNGALNLGKS